MDTQRAKRTSIIWLVGICVLLIIVQVLIVLADLPLGGLLLPLFPIELILAVCGLISVHGWCAPTWHRLSAIGILLIVIAWALFWPIALMLLLPAAVST